MDDALKIDVVYRVYGEEFSTEKEARFYSVLKADYAPYISIPIARDIARYLAERLEFRPISPIQEPLHREAFPF